MTIDTMFVDKYSLVFVRVYHGLSMSVTGHFPILAGYDDKTQRALYVALQVIPFPEREEVPWYFTYAQDGSSFTKYIDEVGEEQSTREIFVLALRHDPIDIVPPYPQAHEGAMDPTGPLHWLSFWPKKDPEYFEDERLRKADEALESILVEIEEENVFLSGFDDAEESQFSESGKGENAD